MRVFVSSQAVDRAPSRSLIDGLRREGVDVDHSPRNPADGIDQRWGNWYESGLDAALERCSSFVIVIDEGWDSSTWMGVEADAATKWLSSSMFFWNPGGVRVKAAGMVAYLRDELPHPLGEAVGRLVGRSAG